MMDCPSSFDCGGVHVPLVVDPFSLVAPDNKPDSDSSAWTPPSSSSWCRVTEIITWNEAIGGFEHLILTEEYPSACEP